MLRMMETRSSLYSRIMPWLVFAAYDLINPHFFWLALVGSWFLSKMVFGFNGGGFSPKSSVYTSTNWILDSSSLSFLVLDCGVTCLLTVWWLDPCVVYGCSVEAVDAELRPSLWWLLGLLPNVIPEVFCWALSLGERETLVAVYWMLLLVLTLLM